MKHILVVAAITIVVTLGVGFLLESADLMPMVASEEGLVVDRMFSLQLWIISFLFSLIVVFMLYSVVVFRRKPGEEDAEGAYITGNTRLEIAWTVIPLIVVIALATLGAQDLREILGADSDELVVEVTGFQFAWRFDYPDYGVTSGTLSLPKDRQIHLRLTSLDVIHSFWVPEFRVKQDAVPGRTTELRFTPTEEGTFALRCAELCGLRHTQMLADVVVMPEAEFEAWLEGEVLVAGEEGSPVELGVRLYQANCQSCHSVDGGEGVGPTFLGSFGTARILETGESVVMDEAYLRKSIVEPGAQVVQGYTNVMPAVYGESLTEQEIEALIAYIRSLGD